MGVPRVFIETSDKYSWLLAPFCYLFNIYWSELQPCVVFGYNPPPFQLPQNFQFFSISSENYPAERWSNGLIQFLNSVGDDYFILLLADYWLTRTVDARGISACHDYMIQHPDVVRFDLSTDRLYSGRAFDVESYGCYDVIETPPDTPYQFSFQAAIWNRRLLLNLLVPDRTPWQTEIYTAIPAPMRVLGIRQTPVKYANAMLKGKLDSDQISLIHNDHFQRIFDMIPQELKG